MKHYLILVCVLILVTLTFAQTPPVSPPGGNAPPPGGNAPPPTGPAPTVANPPVSTAPAAPEPEKEISLWETIKAGGVIGGILILLSILVVGLTIEHFMRLRSDRFVPPQLENQVARLLETDQIPTAIGMCQASKSLLGITLAAGLERHGGTFGMFEMQSAMQEAAERAIGCMRRKLDYLSFIAAISPMLGLLGTVTGMISAFNVISLSGGTAKPSSLAGGISEALVTTCMGLIVAIPTLFFANMFNNRIDSCVAETEAACDRLTAQFRK